MEELLARLVVAMIWGLGLLLWEAAKLMWFFLLWVAPLLWRFLLWASAPIREEIAFRLMMWKERKKERMLLAAHQQAIRHIDKVVVRHDSLHRQALAQADRHPSLRQSG